MLVNKMVFRCDVLSEELLMSGEESAETYCAHFKVPMMDTRILCNTKYYIPKENLVIISSEGNQEVR